MARARSFGSLDLLHVPVLTEEIAESKPAEVGIVDIDFLCSIVCSGCKFTLGHE